MKKLKTWQKPIIKAELPIEKTLFSNFKIFSPQSGGV